VLLKTGASDLSPSVSVSLSVSVYFCLSVSVSVSVSVSLSQVCFHFLFICVCLCERMPHICLYLQRPEEGDREPELQVDVSGPTQALGFGGSESRKYS